MSTAPVLDRLGQPCLLARRLVALGSRTLLVLVLAAALMTPACHTTDASGKGSMAQVLITGVEPGVVRGAAISVFEEKGYTIGRMDRETLVFEKKASGFSNLAYGNWTETAVWQRVKVEVEKLGDSVRLHCTAYLVRDKGAATEEEVKTYRRGPWQKLVNEIAARLKPAPAK